MLVSGTICSTRHQHMFLICWCGRIFAYVGVSVSHLLVSAIFLLVLHENTRLCCHQCTAVYVGVKCMLVSERALYVGV